MWRVLKRFKEAIKDKGGFQKELNEGKWMRRVLESSEEV